MVHPGRFRGVLGLGPVFPPCFFVEFNKECAEINLSGGDNDFPVFVRFDVELFLCFDFSS